MSINSSVYVQNENQGEYTKNIPCEKNRSKLIYIK